MGNLLLRSIAILAIALTGPSCGGRGNEPPAPSAPEAAVRGFLNAVRANSLLAMGDLWGTAKGRASRSMDRDELEERLTVIRIYLKHEEFEILQPEEALPRGELNTRVVRVRLTRAGCAPVVPFTVVRWRGGWLVSSIELAAVGHPARPCRQ